MAKIKGLKFETMTNTYTVKDKLGEGGSGVVFLVEDAENRQLALKRLSPNVVSSEKNKRFRNEMVFLSRTAHDNLVPVLDTGFHTEEGRKIPFYVMPFYKNTLRNLISEGIPSDKVLRLFGGILDGVECLHLKNVWHRDLKPENILFDEPSAQLRIADLGIAHFEEEELHTAVITKVGSKLANFEYAAPEQRRKGEKVDHKADIYALGLILNEMFTSRVLQGVGHRTIAQVAPDYAYLDDLVAFMAQQDAVNRPGSIDNIKQQLIGRKNDFIRLQKIDTLENTVVPSSQVIDPLINTPVKGHDLTYENGLLIFHMNHLNKDWVEIFQSLDYGTAIWLASPAYFNARGNTLSINAKEQDIQRIVDDFKRWVNMTNQRYKTKRENDQKSEETRQRQLLQDRVEKEKKEASIRENILSKIKFD
jgi:serine/threonine protein kinase